MVGPGACPDLVRGLVVLVVLAYSLPGGYFFLPGCAPLRNAGTPLAMHFRMREEFLMSDLAGRRL